MSDHEQGENPFQRMNRHTPEQLRVISEREFEHAKVRHTLGRLKHAKLFREWERESRRHGDGYVTFGRFNEAFPGFPIRLACSKLARLDKPLHANAKSIHPEWFKNFMRLPFMVDYEDLYDRLGIEAQLKPVGLVFPRKGFQHGLVVHNGPVDDYVPPKTSCHLYVGGGDDPMHLVVQPYTAMLDHIRKTFGWDEHPAG